ncbi:MAG: hypothetical protein EBT75_01915 [Proteobacteria bacterium]|nr:hypothetical protein [Pseudomonadota bacterium]NBS50116.1 hypothetical protein [Verrucomicrobiota bacterium]
MTNVIGNDLKRLDLCEECAKKSGTIHSSAFLAGEVLLQVGLGSEDLSTQCPKCGYPLDSLQKTGRLGCATCYEKFSASLQEALTESQRDTLHRGKRPARKKAGREEWEAELQQLIAMEDFEGAARLRDQMAQKKQLSPRRTKPE